MGTLALLPVIFAIVFGVIAFITSDSSHKNSPKWILIIAILTLIIVVGKETLIPDVVAKYPKFEQKKIESKKEDLKDLEGLE